jgi:hypothetical protein
MPQSEALLQLGDLRRDRGRINGVVFEYLECDQVTIRGQSKPITRCGPVGAALTAVAVASKRAATSFEVGGADIGHLQHAV